MTSMLPTLISLVLRSKRHSVRATARDHRYFKAYRVLTRRMYPALPSTMSSIPVAIRFKVTLHAFFRIQPVPVHLSERPLHAIKITAFRLLSNYSTSRGICTTLNSTQSPWSNYQFRPGVALFFKLLQRALNKISVMTRNSFISVFTLPLGSL